MGDGQASLSKFNKAISLSADNALVPYHRAKVLIALKKYSVRVHCSVGFPSEFIGGMLNDTASFLHGFYLGFLFRSHGHVCFVTLPF